MSGYRSLSLWHDTLPEGEPRPRPALTGPATADVAIVGAGFTGLWTAYYLKTLRPELSVTVLDSEIAGFGASGRNGGWASGEFSLNVEKTIAQHGIDQVRRLFQTVYSSIDEIGRVAAAEGIEADFHKGGTVTLATSAAQAERLRKEVESSDRLFEPGDHRWMDATETARHVRSDKAYGAVFTPHCAAIHPAKLVRGLADAVERLGATIHEKSPVVDIAPGRVTTTGGTVAAGTVLQCTEAFSAGLPRGRRWVAPVYSLMLATEPLPQPVWDAIGLDDRPTFNDGRHLIIYGQRTADGRLAFGGRGAPYHYRSAMSPDFERDAETHTNIDRVLRWLFPQLGEAQITHRWGGAVAVPRDWTASVVFDPGSRIGRAGGYVGAGVTASNLAGRTLADLSLGRETDLVSLPWVNHRNRRWEPEPLRFLGINLGRQLAPLADSIEFRRGRPARLTGGLLHWLTGH